ncbi:AP-1 complex-associated regulatory protein-like isoform X3 [Paramormyrops kingsleyae]|uniref:Adaptor related protein complex 1 associated regulatory protein n=2 Tax=Paramormyrops kingsleyae TaxID=1676925 RepID=A0A3B3R518_9TELE|nr:AP-1 complex-associated regulatory protein-like isoform X2 [Paramormyrops kingsleyae]
MNKHAMGNCWTRCCAIFRKETNRIKRGGGSKYFKAVGDHCTVEFENLVESDEEGNPGSCLRAISEEEMAHLKEQRYAAISDKQTLVDERLRAELAAEEERLRQEEEAECTAQREASRRVRERRWQEQAQSRDTSAEAGSCGDPQTTLVAGSSTGVPQQEALRSSSVAMATPSTGSGRDLISRRQRSLNDDGSSEELEWDGEEGESQAEMVQQSGAWDRGTSLEWEDDFVSARAEDCDDPEFDGFVNPVLDAPSWDSDQQDR